MNHQAGPEACRKVPVLGLMANHIDAKKSTDTATQDDREKEALLRNPPFFLLRPLLIIFHLQEGDEIDDQQVDDDNRNQKWFCKPVQHLKSSLDQTKVCILDMS